MKRSLLYREPRPKRPIEHTMLAYGLLAEGVVLAFVAVAEILKSAGLL